jgi:Holliday junction resolvase RusA-like endonuclease
MPVSWPFDARYALHVVAYRGTARRCDADNLLKLVLDSLNTLAFLDDNQVDVMHIEKREDRAEPRTEVRLAVIASQEAA